MRIFRLKGLKLKIFLSNLIIVIAMFVLVSAFLLKLNTDQARITTLSAAHTSLSQASIYLKEKAASIRNAVDSVALSQQTLDILNMDNKDKYADIVQWNIDYNFLVESVMKNTNNSDIVKISIFTQNELANVINTPLVYRLSGATDTKWFTTWASSPDSYVWHAASDIDPLVDEEYICFTRNLLYSYYNYKTLYVGYVPREVIDTLLNINALDEYTSFFVMNPQGQSLSGSKNLPVAYLEQIMEQIRQKSNDYADDVHVQTQIIDGKQYILGSNRIPNTNLYLTYIYSFSGKISDMVRTSLGNMLIIMLIILPLVLLLSLAISFSVTRRIDRLKENMVQASEGDFDMMILQSSQDDEIGVLTKHFNFMLTKISLLMDAQYAYGKRIKELELKSLQAQINPHFLYNTLDLIKWRAVEHNDVEMKDLVSAMSNYYRKSLGKGKDIVTLVDEIEHITSYVYIQNKRFDNCIRLNLDIPEALKDCAIPKITLQPIAENAIVHGLLEKDEPSGTILIQAVKSNDILTISIIDDGAGMSQRKADGLLSESSDGSITGSGYGLKNIEERLQILFGKSSGLRFKSTTGAGTTVMVTMPARSLSAFSEEAVGA